MSGNASIDRLGTPLPHVPASPRAEVVYWCQWSVLHQNRFRYTMGPERTEMFDHFDRLIADTDTDHKTHADCSQFGSALLHHVGNRLVTHTDWTGTLLEKGELVRPSHARPADIIIFGGGEGEHAAVKTYNGYCIGFGHWPGSPNRVGILELSDWFRQHGHPGVRYLSFLD